MSGRFKDGVPRPAAAPAEAFIAGAPGKTVYPWDDDKIARRPSETYINAKIPTKHFIQIAWVSFYLGKKKREIISEALRQYLERELTNMGVEP